MSLFDNIPEGTDIIEVRKKVNKMLSEARKKAKPPKCILCGKEQSSFCNSHSVPKMVLKNIAKAGKLYRNISKERMINILRSNLKVTTQEKGFFKGGIFK